MNREPVWITKRAVLAIHARLLAQFGGLPGLRDEGLLESALGRPRHLLAYEKADLFAMAAAYAAGIIENHPFLDGNKRAAFMTAYSFLGVNGWELDAPEEEVVLQTLALAVGQLTEDEYADWLKRYCRRDRRAKPVRRRKRRARLT